MATGKRMGTMRDGAARLARIAMVAAGALAMTAGTAAAQSYTVTDLGTLGGRQSTAIALNNAGQVAGDSWMAGNTTQHSFVWSDGIMIDITGTYSVARAMNAAGQVTGEAIMPDGGMRAFLSTNGVMTDLGSLSGGASYGFAGREVATHRVDNDTSRHPPALLAITIMRSDSVVNGPRS